MRAGATVERAILDDGVEIGAEASVGAGDGEIALIGLRASVPPGLTLAPGPRFPQES